jgi:DNA-binding transcriptional LysR family regulator
MTLSTLVDLRELEVFRAVAHTLHFGKAAADLQLAPATVSELIKRLEQRLGGPLFIRTTRRVSLTALGEVFATECQRALDQLERAMSVGRGAASGVGVPLQLGLALDVGQDLLGTALDMFHETHPDQVVLPQPLRTADQIRALLEQRLHVGIAWEPVVPLELTSTTLTHEPFMAMVPAGHPLESAGAVPVGDLGAWPLIMWSRDLNQWTYDRCIAAFTSAGVTPQVTYTAWGIDAMAPLISSGLGIGMTASSIAESKRYAGISFIPVEAPGYECRRMAIYRKDERHPAALALIEAFHQAANR